MKIVNPKVLGDEIYNMAVESPDMESTTNNSLSFTQRVRRFTPMVLFMTLYEVLFYQKGAMGWY